MIFLITIYKSSIQYDANGNRISGFGLYFEYNNFNQLVRIRQNNATGAIIEEYTYDHTGNRIQKYEPQRNQTTYYWDKNFIQIVNSSGTFDTIYYYDEKDLVARKELSNNNKTFYYHPDHLGSTSLITNQSGAVIEETTYEPFGEVSSGGSDRFLYTGKELDPGTGLEYYGARYYDPSKASQFIQPDTVIPDIYDPQALNAYAYVRNNPYAYIDPSGNFFNPIAAITTAMSTEFIIAIIAGIATIAGAATLLQTTGAMPLTTPSKPPAAIPTSPTGIGTSSGGSSGSGGGGSSSSGTISGGGSGMPSGGGSSSGGPSIPGGSVADDISNIGQSGYNRVTQGVDPNKRFEQISGTVDNLRQGGLKPRDFKYTQLGDPGHVKEMQNTLRGLENSLKDLERLRNHPGTSNALKFEIDKKVNYVKTLITRASGALGVP